MSPELYQRYKKASELYAQMIAAGDDDEKWFNLIIEVEDEQFVCFHINCRLGKNPLNKRLWKMFIKFQERKNINYRVC